MKRYKLGWQVSVVSVLLIIFLTCLFFMDNKYQSPPPYGKSGIISISEKDLNRSNPIFLIDGWLLTDARVTALPTYIGEFSSLQRGELSVSPHGRALYRLTIRYDGTPRTVSVNFPQLYLQYSISMDGKQYTNGVGNGRITFLLTPGEHDLSVETSSKAGYYSGMYFPPSLGTDETIRMVENIQNFSYVLAFLTPLVLAVFTLFLWRTGGRLSRWFGILCCCYAVYMFRHFVFLFSMPVVQYWFLIQSLALYGLCFSVVQLTVSASASGTGNGWKWVRLALIVLPVILILLCFFIPIFPWAVFVHGKLTDAYYIFTFFATAYCALRGAAARGWESRYTLSGCIVFGVGLLANLFFSYRFEPIRFFWQFEWCGLLLVLLFSAMMVSRSRHILRENDMLTNHLEEQVKNRTEEVTRLLEERKAFFSDMAHDLKAPVFATQSFIEAIRKSNLGVDMELHRYLDLAEIKQREMARRLQGLSAINALDRIEGKLISMSLKGMLEELYSVYHGESEVRSVYFYVEQPEEDAFFMAQPEKLDILFENLIYNALRATPCNGSIHISAKAEGGKIQIIVKDSGCGIPKEELPYIFRRFYVGSNNRENGTGLGLYIVHSIVEEFGGTISVRSEVNRGTEFILEFPQDK